jgi:hypothetical protein
VTYPPNPVRNLDNSLTADQAAGRAFYFNHAPNGQELPSDTFHACNGCHVLDPAGNAQYGVAKPGFFGTDGRYSFETETQYFKVPHLRNAYQKVGMFGMTNTFGLPIPQSAFAIAAFLPAPLNDLSFQGDQVRGFGFLHDGSVDTMYRFFGSTVFAFRDASNAFPNPFGITEDAAGIQLRRQIEQFVLAYDSNLAPIVGQQVTLTWWNASVAGSRIDLLLARAVAGECDVVVHGSAGTGWLYQPQAGTFEPNRSHAKAVTDAKLRALAEDEDGALTYTAVPPGAGVRLALDRDMDGVMDGD